LSQAGPFGTEKVYLYMDYRNTISYISSFINFEKIPKYQYAAAFKLERMNAILEALGNPHKDLDVIHVAGSKGKGSTCAITAYILKEAGYKVGLYTSPHLVDFRERIRILNSDSQGSGEFEGMIGEEEINEISEEIKPVAENFRKHDTMGNASFFEILTACAFLYFKKKQVDVAVLETGLGGRLDATNVAMPLASGITNISLEHTDKLGNTLSEIAYEKAGIIKEHGLVVSASQEKEAIEIIRKVCAEKGAGLCEIGKDIKYSILNSDEKTQIFDLKGPGYFYKNLETNLIGCHQVENASISIGMLKLMAPGKFNIRENDIKKGLIKAAWPGRLQVIQKNPYIVLDGAQNPASAAALADSIKKLFNYKKLICVFGISSDKDIKGVSSILDAASDIIILTKAKNNPRAEDISRLKQNFQSSRPGLEETSDIDEAMQKALKLADKDDLILVTGSLFVVGDAIQYFKLIGMMA
jgi:dihydrofolate synthase/folylpolyglutamate synthase